MATLALIGLSVVASQQSIVMADANEQLGSSDQAAITAGASHTCALTAVGAVKCWGRNHRGQLGDGTTTNSIAPVAVTGLSSGVIAISAGLDHTCAVTSAGAVKCWGYNPFGQLGNSSTTNSSTPVNVTGLSTGIAAIAAGGTGHTCALTTTGAVKCWGNNSAGQLGNSSTTNSSTPVDVTGLSAGVTAITTGDLHTCALTTAGGVKCWGYNYYGQLGFVNPGDESIIPGDVTGLTTGVTAITAGVYHTCALTTAGAVKCWGYNWYGQLGNSSTADAISPVNVTGLTTGIAAIAAGGYYTCALTTAGGMKCWGTGGYGGLGDGTMSDRTSPVNVSGPTTGTTAITAGGYHTCSLNVSGEMKCWGYNSNGQLGDGTITNRSVPVLVSSFTRIETTPPTVTLARSGATSTSATLTFTITGNENITCSTLSTSEGVDFTFTNISAITSITQTSSTLCTITATSSAAADAVTVTSTLTAAGSFSMTDTAGNAQTTLTGAPQSIAVTRTDTTPPTVTLARSGATSTSATLTFTITGNENITCSTLSTSEGVDFTFTNISAITSITQTSSTLCTITATSSAAADAVTVTSTLTAAGSFSMTDTAGNAQTTLTGAPQSIAVTPPTTPTTTTITTTTTSTTATTTQPLSSSSTSVTPETVTTTTALGQSSISTIGTPSATSQTSTTTPQAPSTGSTKSTTTTTVSSTTTFTPTTISTVTPERSVLSTLGLDISTVDELVKRIDVSNGSALFINGSSVETKVSTTLTTFTISAYNAMVSVRCYDSAGNEITLSGDSRFELRSGDTVELSASGFKPKSRINAAVFSEPVLLGELLVNGNGAGTKKWSIPASLSAGLHTLVVSGHLAEADDAVFGLRIVAQGDSFISRVTNSWIVRILLMLAIFAGLVIPARIRRRRETA